MFRLNEMPFQTSKNSFNQPDKFKEKSSHVLNKYQPFTIAQEILNPIGNWHQPAKIALTTVGITAMSGIGYLASKALFAQSNPIDIVESKSSLLKDSMIVAGTVVLTYVFQAFKKPSAVVSSKDIEPKETARTFMPLPKSGESKQKIEKVHPKVTAWLQTLETDKQNKQKEILDICKELYDCLKYSLNLSNEDKRSVGKFFITCVDNALSDSDIEDETIQEYFDLLLCIDRKLALELIIVCYKKKEMMIQDHFEVIIRDFDLFKSFIVENIKTSSMGKVVKYFLENVSLNFSFEMLKYCEKDQIFHKNLFDFFHHVLSQLDKNDEPPEFIKNAFKAHILHLNNDELKQLIVLRFLICENTYIKERIKNIFTGLCETSPDNAKKIEIVQSTFYKILEQFPKSESEYEEIQIALEDLDFIRPVENNPKDYVSALMSFFLDVNVDMALELALNCACQKGNKKARNALDIFIELTKDDETIPNRILEACNESIEVLKSIDKVKNNKEIEITKCFKNNKNIKFQKELPVDALSPQKFQNKMSGSYFVSNIFYSFFDSQQYDIAEKILEKCVASDVSILKYFIGGAIEKLNEQSKITSPQLLNNLNTQIKPLDLSADVDVEGNDCFFVEDTFFSERDDVNLEALLEKGEDDKNDTESASSEHDIDYSQSDDALSSSEEVEDSTEEVEDITNDTDGSFSTEDEIDNSEKEKVEKVIKNYSSDDDF